MTALTDQYTTMNGGWVDASQVYVTVAGVPVPIEEKSLQIDGAIGQRSTATFLVDDRAGQYPLLDGSVVAIYASNGGALLYEGVLLSAKRARVGIGTWRSGVYPVQCKCGDWHYLADKRIFAAAFQYQTCGYMVRNFVDNVLSAEGVTYTRGVNILGAQQSNVETSNLSSFTSENSATLSQDTTTAAQGSASLRVVTPGSVAHEGVLLEVPIASFKTNGVYTLSVWLKSSGTPTLRLYAVSNSAGIGQASTVTLTSAWTRYQLTVQVPSSFAGLAWIALGADTNTTTATTFWLDEAQIELGPGASAWVLGGTGANLLSANQSSAESGTTGFTTVVTGVTLARDTSQYFAGQSSLKVVFDGTATNQGVDASLPSSSFSVNAAYTFSAWVYGSSGGLVRLYVRDETAGALLAGTNSVTTTLGAYWQRLQVTVVMPSSLNAGGYGLVVDDNAVANAITFWVDGLQVERCAASAWEVGGAPQTIQEGPTVVYYTAPYIPGSKFMDDQGQLAGFYWHIDQYKVMWFQLPTTQVAPFTYDGTQGILGQQTIENASPLYRNAQWLLNIPDVTAPQSETRHGDGVARAFTMGYPLNNVPVITVNGTTSTVGIKGIDDQTHSKHWYWAKGDPVIAQEANDAALISTDTLVVSYIGQWVSTVYSSDVAATNALAALDGTSGIVEEAHQDATIQTSAAGFSLAAALLARYGVHGRQIVFKTRVGGLLPGMLLNINMLSPGWQLGAAQALIEQVQTNIVGMWFEYTVTAIVGPFNQNWVQFYQHLAGLGQIVQGSAGGNQTLNLVANFTATWTWAASFTATTHTCPVIASSLHCGPSVIVC